MRFTPAMKTWIRRLVLGTGILVVGLALLALTASLVVRQVAVHRAKRDFPPPGRLVELDGRVSHIYCTGTGSPTILLESGLDDRGSWGWDYLRDELSQIHVKNLDRAVHASVSGSGPKTIVLAAGGLALPARILYVGAHHPDPAGAPLREGP